MRIIFFTLVCVLLTQSLWGQSYWQQVAVAELHQPSTNLPKAFQVFHLNKENLQMRLAHAPAETSHSFLLLQIPLPNGDLAAFQVASTHDMHPDLAKKYPEIRSFLGYAVENPSDKIRFTFSPSGFHAIFTWKGEEVYIDPYSEDNANLSMVYYTKDNVVDAEVLEQYQESHKQSHLLDKQTPSDVVLDPSLDLEVGGKNNPFRKEEKGGNAAVQLYKYSIAIACTGEYAQANGRTTRSVLASINTALNRINFAFERDAAIRFELVANNDKVIFLDANTDPYANDDFSLLINTNIRILNDSIGFNNYDVGHVFSGDCRSGVVGSGGISTICGQAKGRGASCQISKNDNFYIGIVCHELGHQFSALHTWNNCPGSNEDGVNYNPDSAYEPGGGVTIMSYPTACGNQNYGTQEFYYHVNSIESILDFSRTGSGSTCAEVINTTNNTPSVVIPLKDNFFIPISTPFELTATATDSENDALTYCWEQYDKDPIISNIGEPRGNDPSFRSFAPVNSPKRVFPRLQNIINNTRDNSEVLPTYGRNLTFRCTVRDNNAQGSGVDWAEVKFRSDETAGPFLVTRPNDMINAWQAGSYQAIHWNVANTDNARVNCQRVNIRLSMDGGLTYPMLLAENVRNSGEAFINVPNVVTSSARIKVEAADNIFFDISDKNFSITPASAPSFAVQANPFYQTACLPNTVEVQVQISGFAGFNSPVDLQLVELPTGVTATFEPSTLLPNQSSTLTVNIEDTGLNGFIALQFQALVAGVDTLVRNIELDLVSNDFTDFTLLAPEDNTRGILGITDFSWTSVASATSYDFELATSPAFGEAIVASASNLTTSTFKPNVFLEENKIYFWRVRPVNQCGPGAFSIPKAFQTLSVQCTPFEQTTPVTISGSGAPTVESVINIANQGTITDLNLPIVEGNYQPVRFVEISLISPAGTQAILFNDLCGSTTEFKLGFDDEAPSAITCPPSAGVVQRPLNPLSIFDGEDIKGDWKLRFRIKQTGFGSGGRITRWQLESCGDVVLNAPYLVKNDTFFLPPATRSQIWVETLLAEDIDNSYDEIVYQLVSLPSHGTLYKGTTPLKAGDTFTQQEIEGFAISYEHDGSAARTDQFNFILRDTDGGWLGTPQFNIVISEDATVDTEDELWTEQLNLYPNPTKDEVTIESTTNVVQIRVYDMQGKLMMYANNRLPVSTLDVSSWAKGMYWIQIQTEKAIVTRKLVVQ